MLMRVTPLILCLAAGVNHAAEPYAAPPAQANVSAAPAPTPLQAKAETRAAYVGVVTSAATPALREQLGLPGGVGVVIDSVEADSPAQHAGLIVHDVITKLDDQLVINVHQFSVLVRLRKPGETVNLSVVRRGKPTTASLQLGERTVPAGEEINPLVVGGAPRGGGRISSIVTQTDGKHVITLTTHGEADRHVRVADTSGKLIFEGPLNTPEDHAGVPSEVRGKIETIERNWEKFKQLRSSSPVPKPQQTPPAE